MKKSAAYVEHEPSVRFNRIRKKAFNDFNNYIHEGKIIINKNSNCFCGSNKFEQLSSIDRYGLNFPTRICTQCGLISQVQSISADTIDFFYDDQLKLTCLLIYKLSFLYMFLLTH